MLNLIGIGLWDKKDISVKGLDLVKKSDYVYLENYTSKLGCSVEELEEFYGKKVIVVDRAFVEDGSELISKAKDSKVCLLIIGDVFSATTHISLFDSAKSSGVEVNVVHNASILTAVGITGLELYKFGKVTSIPFHESSSFIDVIKENGSMHSLILLDLKPSEGKFMKIQDAVVRLKGHFDDRIFVGCCGLGSPDYKIVSGKLSDLEKFESDLVPQCLICVGDMHFVEKESIDKHKI